MTLAKVNVIGIVGSLLLFYVALSRDAWWSLVGGIEEETFSVFISPFHISISILGKPVAIPIIPYLNLSAQLVMLLTAFMLFVGSIFPLKGWAKYLYSHRALAMTVLFVVTLYIGLKLAENYTGTPIPLMGEATLHFRVTQETITIETETPIRSNFNAQYWLALLASVLASLAKVSHGRLQSRRCAGHALYAHSRG